MKKTTKSETDETLANKWRTSPRTIRQWRTDGAPLDRDDRAMRRWLAVRRTLPEGTMALLMETRKAERQATAQSSEDATPGRTGAGMALRRLEEEEAKAHGLYVRAQASGDEMESRLALRRWTELADRLLRYDAQVESSRRDSGQLVQRAIAEDVLRTVGRAFAIGVRSAFQAGAPRLVGQTTEGIARELEVIATSTSTAVIGYGCGSPSELPQWAADALTAGFDPSGQPWGTDAQCKRLVEYLLPLADHDARQQVEGAVAELRKMSAADQAEFRAWKKAKEAERAEQRRDWCRRRAAEGLPVPDASDAELQEFPGLTR